MTLRANPGSLHDPSSQVFADDAAPRVVRTLDRAALADFEALVETDFWRHGQESGEIVATTRLADLPGGLGSRWAAALEHAEIPVVSYPSEWTFSMLRDAALLHLGLLERSVAEGMITKDASAFNVQFVGSRPVFIDVGSFTKIRPGEPWYGFRQFCEHFLNPLVLHVHGRVSLPDSLRGTVNGLSPATTARLLPRRAKMRPSLFTTVVLHAKAEKRLAGRDSDMAGALGRAGAGPELITAQIRRLRRIVESLGRESAKSEWSGYTERSHYSAAALSAKEDFVARCIEATRPTQVLDLGANDGAFSRLAVHRGAQCSVATDSDAVVVDRLYSELAASRDGRILPLCVDLTDMAGGQGWAGRQRAWLLDRVRPDLVLCLALIHHLAITASIRVTAIVDLLAGLHVPVVLEVPLPDDPMAAMLLSRKRDRSVAGYSGDEIEAEILRRFTIASRETLDGGTRILYELRPN